MINKICVTEKELSELSEFLSESKTQTGTAETETKENVVLDLLLLLEPDPILYPNGKLIAKARQRGINLLEEL